MSDKIASGSDDGNFFVWDKATGRLDGIWEGDGSVVNGQSFSSTRTQQLIKAVTEQHPTLPLVAVSGIDNSVKVCNRIAERDLRS
jgi:WD and tetratricopeptide repeat-containing protein 1